MTREWVIFRLDDRRRGQKTDVWQAWSLDGSHAGQVRWNSRWRKYCFFPASQTAFDQDCLRVIAEFVKNETRKHRVGKRAFYEASA